MTTATIQPPVRLQSENAATDAEKIFVTLTVADQLCGIPVLSVRDILAEQTITRIPLAPPEVAGSLNLRGRIVTAIDLRRRLHLAPAPNDMARMSVVVERGVKGPRPVCGSLERLKRSEEP